MHVLSAHAHKPRTHNVQAKLTRHVTIVQSTNVHEESNVNFHDKISLIATFFHDYHGAHTLLRP